MHSLPLLPQGFAYAGLVVCAFLAGAINAAAAGGGFLTFPGLLHAGILPVNANATNTVALWPGQVASIAGYRKDATAHMRLIVPCLIAAVVGGITGAWVLLHTRQQFFFRMIPWLFLMGALLFAVSGPVSRAVQRRQQRHSVKKLHVIWLSAILALVCFYIGYFGSGAGFITMTVLSLFGVTRLAEVNALKVITTTTANGVAVVYFIAAGVVAWHYCVAMMIACAAGGYLGAHNARKMSDRVLRPIIVLIGFVVAAYFFWRQAQA